MNLIICNSKKNNIVLNLKPGDRIEQEINIDNYNSKLLTNTINHVKKTNSIIVIKEEEQIRLKLEKEKLNEFKDFIFERFYNKKIVIFYGNCHTESIIKFLRNNNEFTKEYEIYDIPQIQNIKNKLFFSSIIFKKCDLFIHQSIRENNRYGSDFSSKNIIRKLKKECNIISMPNIYQLPKFFFPQYYNSEEIRFKKSTYFFRDRIIDDLYFKGGNINQIYEKYMDKNLYNKEKLDNEYHNFIKKVKSREKDWDIKVSDFIIENFNKKNLFYDPNHPTTTFFKHVYLEILNILKIKDTSLLNYSQVIRNSDLYQMPICLSIIKNFELKFEIIELRVTGRKVFSGKMLLKEYISQYISLVWLLNSAPFLVRIKSFFYFSMKMFLKGEFIRKIMKRVKK